MPPQNPPPTSIRTDAPRTGQDDTSNWAGGQYGVGTPQGTAPGNAGSGNPKRGGTTLPQGQTGTAPGQDGTGQPAPQNVPPSGP